MSGALVEMPTAREATGREPTAPLRGVAALATVLGGLAIIATAIGIATAQADRSEPTTAAVPPALDSEISVTELTYAPGHAGGWHLHNGVHSVVVLDGTLTIYDEFCGRQDYGPGASYLGGSRPHLALNEAPDECGLLSPASTGSRLAASTGRPCPLRPDASRDEAGNRGFTAQHGAVAARDGRG